MNLFVTGEEKRTPQKIIFCRFFVHNFVTLFPGFGFTFYV